MTRAVVTGASGFIGKTLTKALLDRGMEIWAVVRDKRKLDDIKNENLHIVEADFAEYPHLAEQIDIRGFDVCFHLAWNGTWGAPFRDYALQLGNAKAACDMVEQAAALGCRRFILTSTIVQLEAQRYMLSDEGTPRVSCIYGTAKNTAALLCRIQAGQLDIGWNTAVLSSVYGAGDCSGMIENVLIKSFLAGERPRLATGENRYDCTYVDDVVSGLIAIAEKGAMNRTYYVGHREGQTFRQIVCGMRDALAPEMELRFGEYPDGAPIDYSLIDVDALYNDTGFEPVISLDEGVRRTAQWLETKQIEPGGVISSSIFYIVCVLPRYAGRYAR